MKLVPTAVTRSVASSVLRTKHNSPHIFFALGVAGVIGGTVLACRATLRASDVVDEIATDVTDSKEIAKVKIDDGTFDNRQHQHDMGYIYARGAYKLGVLYGPAIVVTGVSIAALTGSHITLTRRNAALTVALTTVTKAYNDYRERVILELGPERELDIHRAIENKVVELEDGSKEIVKIVDPNGLSQYARIFDETSPCWEKHAETNKMFVQAQMNYANNRLHSKGHLFLNEVYQMLGFEHTSAGSIVGWSMKGDGDKFVDFGLFEAYNSRFVNGMERSIVLDFNVDGVMYHLLGDGK